MKGPRPRGARALAFALAVRWVVAASLGGGASVASASAAVAADRARPRSDDGGAKAPRAAEPDAVEQPKPRKGHRDGFMLGLAGGPALAFVSGFPNDPRKSNREEFRTRISGALAHTESFWLGGALADWLTFGAGLRFAAGGASVGDKPVELSSTSFVFHADVFPAYASGDAWRDLAVTMRAGAGVFTASPVLPEGSPASAASRLVDGGFGSHVGLAATWEALRAWKFALGPTLGVERDFSPLGSATYVFVAVRAALYARP